MCVWRYVRPGQDGRTHRGEAGSVGLGHGSVPRAPAGRKGQKRSHESESSHRDAFTAHLRMSIAFHFQRGVVARHRHRLFSPADGHLRSPHFLPIMKDPARICVTSLWVDACFHSVDS